MFKIKEFSILTRISVKMLRHYDQIGLLVPAYVDEHNRYRYYKDEQLILANRIQSLKDMGFSLAMIIKIIENYKDEEALQQFLSLQKTQKKEEIIQKEKQLQLIEHAIAMIHEPSLPICDINVKLQPSRSVLCFRCLVSAYEEEENLWCLRSSMLSGSEIVFTNPELDIGVFHEVDREDGLLDIEIQSTVLKKGNVTAPLFFQDIPEQLIASIMYQGSYKGLAVRIQLLLKWIKESHYVQTGPFFQIYHRSPKVERKEDAMITELCIPIKEDHDV